MLYLRERLLCTIAVNILFIFNKKKTIYDLCDLTYCPNALQRSYKTNIFLQNKTKVGSWKLSSNRLTRYHTKLIIFIFQHFIFGATDLSNIRHLLKRDRNTKTETLCFRSGYVHYSLFDVGRQFGITHMLSLHPAVVWQSL